MMGILIVAVVVMVEVVVVGVVAEVLAVSGPREHLLTVVPAHVAVAAQVGAAAADTG